MLLLLSTYKIKAQVLGGSQVRDDIYDKEHVPARKPVPYYYLREADVMWKKRIWRMIDLKEKMNHPLYYPTIPQNDRYSLIDLILYGIQYENLEVYDATIDDEFKVPLTFTQVKEEGFGAVKDTQYVEDVVTGELKPQIIEGEMNSWTTKKYMLKEIWYFDNQRSVMKCRIVGICPIREYFRPEDLDQEDVQMQKICWVYFPSLRHLLASHEVFNPYNDAERRTFDDIFFKRKFSSYIYKETNVYDNRYIGSYKIGLDVMYESERIKDFLFKVEHDLWEY